ncbi:MAG: imelysin family protein [Psychrobium sp.]
MNLKEVSKISLAVVLGLGLAACSGDDGKDGTNGTNGVDGKDGSNGHTTFVARDDVIKTNANIAYASYSDSLITAVALKESIDMLVANPTAENFTAAKQAWLDAREPYGQTEVYRFREGPIDFENEDGTTGPEGAINAWPLGEALIDYISTSPAVNGNAFQEDETKAISSNIIADATNYPNIDKATVTGLFETNEDERNVTTGYHAIEFLLWGQDLNLPTNPNQAVRDATAGQRPLTDFNVSGGCTSGVGNAMADSVCERRGKYLQVAADILIDDLTTVVDAWEPVAGAHYKTFVAGGDASLALILEGMGRLSYGELAGERINVALINNSQEDEHSCFSDNTHRDIYLNAKGVQNSFNASYTRVNGEEITGASIYDLLITEGNPELANKLRASLEATMAAASVIDTKAKTGMPFDLLIQEGIDQENVIAVIKALVAQTDDIEEAIKALNVTTNDLRQDTEEKI